MVGSKTKPMKKMTKKELLAQIEMLNGNQTSPMTPIATDSSLNQEFETPSKAPNATWNTKMIETLLKLRFVDFGDSFSGNNSPSQPRMYWDKLVFKFNTIHTTQNLIKY